MSQIAVIGDLHDSWTEEDFRRLDEHRYAAILFVGDLVARHHMGLFRIADHIAAIETPTFVMPGNHDGPSPWGILATATIGYRPFSRTVRRMSNRLDTLNLRLGDHQLVGFSRHTLGPKLTLIAGRPHAMGGGLSFPNLLKARHDVGTLEQSRARYQALIQEVPSDHAIIFVGHNGPSGLGHDERAPFAVRGRDLGDEDLAQAVALAKETHRVIAVCSGHIHHSGNVRWAQQQDETWYLNAAFHPNQGHVVLDASNQKAPYYLPQQRGLASTGHAVAELTVGNR